MPRLPFTESVALFSGTQVVSKEMADIERLETERNIDGLIAALQAGTRSAAHALVRLGDGRAVPALIQALNSRFVADDAARALGNFGDPRAVEPLIECLGNRRFGNRNAVAEALGRLGDRRAVPALLRALDERVTADELPLFRRHLAGAVDPYLHISAIEALGMIGDPQAVPALEAVLRDEEDQYVRAAEEALAKIRSPEAEQALGPRQAIRDQEREHQALALIGALDNLVQHVPPLADAGLIAEVAGGPTLSLEGWRVTPDGLLYVDGMTAPPRGCQEHTSPMDDLNAVSRGRFLSFPAEQLVVLYGVLLGHEFVSHVLEIAGREGFRPHVFGVLSGCAGSFAHALRHTTSTPRAQFPTFAEAPLEGEVLETWRAEIRAHMEEAGRRDERVSSAYDSVLSTWRDGAAAP